MRALESTTFFSRRSNADFRPACETRRVWSSLAWDVFPVGAIGDARTGAVRGAVGATGNARTGAVGGAMGAIGHARTGAVGGAVGAIGDARTGALRGAVGAIGSARTGAVRGAVGAIGSARTGAVRGAIGAIGSARSGAMGGGGGGEADVGATAADVEGATSRGGRLAVDAATTVVDFLGLRLAGEGAFCFAVGGAWSPISLSIDLWLRPIIERTEDFAGSLMSGSVEPADSRGALCTIPWFRGTADRTTSGAVDRVLRRNSTSLYGGLRASDRGDEAGLANEGESLTMAARGTSVPLAVIVGSTSIELALGVDIEVDAVGR